MTLVEVFLVAFGLSMDAFAVAVCKGACAQRIDWKRNGMLALFFGLFQAGMPVIGYLLGSRFSNIIMKWDHWIAFGLLGAIGVKMIVDVLRKEEEPDVCRLLTLREMLVLAVATSIDALAVGIALAMLQVNILSVASIVGVVTFVLSLAGVIIGNKFGSAFEKKAQFVGGVVLVLIGANILIQHLKDHVIS